MNKQEDHKVSIHSRILFVILLTLIFSVSLFANGKNPKVLIETSMGNIEVELYPDKAPTSVANFLSYVRSGFYKNTIFHRVIRGFMIQAGGLDKDMNPKPAKDPIQNEAKNGLKNKRGTIAYGRTNAAHSATSHFFINTVDNAGLNYSDADYGYAVFGKVTKGMKVVDKIERVKTKSIPERRIQNMPVEPVVILSVKEIKEEEK